jgi:2-polyprenyl-3-methyl-5-hydroxy-6-metoxy-1,4-benzoquinol methylase
MKLLRILEQLGDSKMPRLEENLKVWGDTYNWGGEGDEWSEAWGSSKNLWSGTIYPRIRGFLPVKTILEIAPGYGRCTQFLKHYCEKMIIVDISEKCIKHCKAKFSSDKHIEFHVNDGKTLPMIANESVDFIFSWDSLVHADNDVLRSYISEFSRIMKVASYGFIHHSNLGEYLHSEYCKGVGLLCVNQELINWGDSNDILLDCFSLFKKSMHNMASTNISFNLKFVEEMRYIRYLSDMYNYHSKKGAPPL